MSDIIEKLKSNSFNTVEKWHRKCPECNSLLYSVDNWMDLVMDGNIVVYCENDKNHVFWQNSRESSDILHLNKNSSSINFKSEKDYIWENDNWKSKEELTEHNIKVILLNHLNTHKHVYIDNDIQNLWSFCKDWFLRNNLEMGGSYDSFGDSVTIRTNLDKKSITFKISLKEINR